MIFNKFEASNGSVQNYEDNFEKDSTCTRKEQNRHINNINVILNCLNDVKFPHILPSKKKITFSSQPKGDNIVSSKWVTIRRTINIREFMRVNFLTE